MHWAGIGAPSFIPMISPGTSRDWRRLPSPPGKRWRAKCGCDARTGISLVAHPPTCPFRDQAGNILKWYGHRDRHRGTATRAEDALRRSEAYLAEAQRLSKTGSLQLGAFSSGEIRWSEGKLFRIFQYDRTMKPTVDLILKRVSSGRRDFTSSRRSRVRPSIQGTLKHEFRLMMPDDFSQMCPRCSSFPCAINRGNDRDLGAR